MRHFCCTKEYSPFYSTPKQGRTWCPRDPDKDLLVTIESGACVRRDVIFIPTLRQQFETTVYESIYVDLFHHWNIADPVTIFICLVTSHFTSLFLAVNIDRTWFFYNELFQPPVCYGV